MILEWPLVYEAKVVEVRARKPEWVTVFDRVPLAIREVSVDDAPQVMRALVHDGKQGKTQEFEWRKLDGRLLRRYLAGSALSTAHDPVGGQDLQAHLDNWVSPSANARRNHVFRPRPGHLTAVPHTVRRRVDLAPRSYLQDSYDLEASKLGAFVGTAAMIDGDLWVETEGPCADIRNEWNDGVRSLKACLRHQALDFLAAWDIPQNAGAGFDAWDIAEMERRLTAIPGVGPHRQRANYELEILGDVASPAFNPGEARLMASRIELTSLRSAAHKLEPSGLRLLADGIEAIRGLDAEAIERFKAGVLGMSHVPGSGVVFDATEKVLARTWAGAPAAAPTHGVAIPACG